jgi:hypothetical protein
MTQSRRELRLQRETSSPLSDDEIILHPEVLRAVAKKMRERRPAPYPLMKPKDYILATIYHEFVDGLDAVADDTEAKVVKFVPQQEDTDGSEGSNRIQ